MTASSAWFLDSKLSAGFLPICSIYVHGHMFSCIAAVLTWEQCSLATSKNVLYS